MTLKPFSIVPFYTGLERDKDAFLLENDAFPILTDAFLYQGRIKRREGNTYLGRLVHELRVQNIGNTAATPFTET